MTARPNGLYLAMPVWGAEYVERFLRYGLPSLCAPGNLPALAEALTTRVWILTNRRDYELMHADVVRQLDGIAQVHFEIHGADADDMRATLAPETRVNGHVMTACHNRVLAEAHQDGFGWLAGWADTVYANGWGERILETMRRGKRALMWAPLDGSPHVLNLLDDMRRDGRINVAPRLLAMRTMFHHGSAFGKAVVDIRRGPGAGVMWKHFTGEMGHRANKGLLVASPNLNVAYLWPERLVQCARSVDDDLVPQALSSLEQIDFVADSDEFCVVPIDGVGEVRHERGPSMYRGTSPDEIADYLRQAHPWKAEFMRRPFWYHDGGFGLLTTAMVREKASAFLDQVEHRCLLKPA